MVIERDNAPYAPPSNVISVLRRFRDRNLPTEIDSDLLKDIGIAAGNASRTLYALAFLGLVDDYERPTDLFHSIQMADDSEYQVILGSAIRSAYQDVFKVADPTKDPQHMIENAFRRFQPASQRRRMAVLFLGLCSEAGIEVLDTPRQRSARAASQAPRQRAQPKAQTETSKARTPQASNVQQPPHKISEVSELRRQYIATLIKRVESLESPEPELFDRIERLIREEENPPSQGRLDLE